ncbi:PepSY domain-containing protein [Blastomonas sp.]|uniref:PepSY domain-containing protein n=1 Tax=Blastomonas sp. TaxID=1909299 RepID=UPI00391B4E16
MGRTLRLIHYWLTAFTLVTVAMVAVTGVLLSLKKDFDVLQPPSAAASAPGLPATPLDRLLAAVAKDSGNATLSWRDVDRIDVRPRDGLAKVIFDDRTEYQVDLHTLEVLQTGYRTSDFLETLHDFSILGDWGKYLLSLPTGIALLVLWGTGAYMFIKPLLVKRRKRRAKALARSA